VRISINVSRLTEHCAYLHEEQEEIIKLLDILNQWERSEESSDVHFFHRQKELLMKQRRMVCERIKILETLEEAFRQCIDRLDRDLKQANDAVAHLESL
jgi:ERCC4-related helicase